MVSNRFESIESCVCFMDSLNAPLCESTWIGQALALDQSQSIVLFSQHFQTWWLEKVIDCGRGPPNLSFRTPQDTRVKFTCFIKFLSDPGQIFGTFMWMIWGMFCHLQYSRLLYTSKSSIISNNFSFWRSETKNPIKAATSVDVTNIFNAYSLKLLASKKRNKMPDMMVEI